MPPNRSRTHWITSARHTNRHTFPPINPSATAVPIIRFLCCRRLARSRAVTAAAEYTGLLCSILDPLEPEEITMVQFGFICAKPGPSVPGERDQLGHRREDESRSPDPSAPGGSRVVVPCPRRAPSRGRSDSHRRQNPRCDPDQSPCIDRGRSFTAHTGHARWHGPGPIRAAIGPCGCTFPHDSGPSGRLGARKSLFSRFFRPGHLSR